MTMGKSDDDSEVTAVAVSVTTCVTASDDLRVDIEVVVVCSGAFPSKRCSVDGPQKGGDTDPLFPIPMADLPLTALELRLFDASIRLESEGEPLKLDELSAPMITVSNTE
jgi:hypothetical protein